MPLIFIITFFVNCIVFYCLNQCSPCYSISTTFLIAISISHLILGFSFIWLMKNLFFFPFLGEINFYNLTYKMFSPFFLSSFSLFVIHWLALCLTLFFTPCIGKICLFILSSCNLSDRFHCSTEKWLYIIIGMIVAHFSINISIFLLHPELLS